MRIAQEEIFGPVLSVIRVQDDQSALTAANDTRFGLSASVYTSDVAAMFRFVDRLDAGIIHVNSPTVGGEAHIPFGGMKATGRRAARDGSRGDRLLHRAEGRLRGLHGQCAQREPVLMSVPAHQQRTASITASDDYEADVYCENGIITAIGSDLPAHRFTADRTIDAARPVRHARRHRRPHPPQHAVRRDDVRRRLRVRHDRRGVRRHHQPGRLRHPVPRPDDAACAGRLDEARRRQGGDRLRLPHDRHRARGRRPLRDGPHGPRRRDHQLQAVHGVSRRLHGGRPDDLPRAAPNRRERRARLHARRERRRHRRAGEGSAAQGTDGAEVSRADATEPRGG